MLLAKVSSEPEDDCSGKGPLDAVSSSQLKQGQLEQFVQDHVQLGIKYLQGGTPDDNVLSLVET